MNLTITKKLKALARADLENGIKTKFLKNKKRHLDFGFKVDDLYIDYSKTHLSSAILDLYVEHAEDINFDEARNGLFSGAKINNSENRSVLHTLLRGSLADKAQLKTPDILPQAQDARRQFIEHYQSIKQAIDSRSKPVTDILHVGIGGSSLGTQLLFESLSKIDETVTIHFISNIDAHQLVSVLEQCDATSTLVIGVSKTFTTQETLQNLHSIGAWFDAQGISNWKNNVYAVTANTENARTFGIATHNIVSFPEWVGGRYSVWSSVSLSAVLVLGIQKFEEFLDGAASVDQHFQGSELKNNLCFIAAALDHYYGNFLGAHSRAVFSYDFRLRSLVDYLQQLETESNGKDRQKNGQPVNEKTAPVVWGGVGTEAQHSVFQMLHQGTALIPSEFILIKTPDHELIEHHQELLANGIAQTAALLQGQSLEDVAATPGNKELPEHVLKAKIFSGDRPSSTIVLESLSPQSLGALLAFYEHRTFCAGVFSNINSFDQMGVELGKKLALKVKPLLKNKTSEVNKAFDTFDNSTLDLIKRLGE